MKESKMNWYEIKNAAEETAEVWIYDMIGEDFFGDGISAKSFVSDLNEITAANIDLHINSPGGSVRDGMAIHNAIARHPAKVTTYVDGLAASIASAIAPAGDKVIMADNSLMMIHSASVLTIGNAVDLRHDADVLEKHDQAIQGIYQRKTGQDLEVIQDAMAKETWFTAEEAVDFGLADKVESGLKAVALAIDEQIMARFKNAPDDLNLRAKLPASLVTATVTYEDGTTADLPLIQSTGAVVDDSDGASQTVPINLEYELIQHRRNK